MLCSLSGQEPEDAVISKKSGHIFERSLITKYLTSSGNICPITNEPLTPDDLLDVKKSGTPAKPRPTGATSIPGMLQLFQTEWDSAMLECFSLKKQLESTKQQLSHTLYQQDAACRVIARLIKERDEARKELAALKELGPMPASSSSNNSVSMEVDEEADSYKLPDPLLQSITIFHDDMFAKRKKRTISPDIATREDLQSYKEQSSHPTHTSSKPGILCVDIHPQDDTLIATGGMDKDVVVFDKEKGVVIAKLEGHGKKVSDVQFHSTDEILFSSSYDKTVKIWRKTGGEYKYASTINKHSAEVVGISVHPSGRFVCSASTDGVIGVHDPASGNLSMTEHAKDAYQSIEFHPDGYLLGSGTSRGDVRIWDIRSMKNVAEFLGHEGRVTDMSFSENGYYMLSTSEDNFLKLWDLRKVRVIQSIEFKSTPSSVNFDFSGNNVVVGADTVRLFTFKTKKTLEPLCTFSAHSSVVTDAKFGRNASYIVTTSMDRTMKFFSK